MDIYTLVTRFKRKFPFTIAWRLRAHSKLAEEVLDNDETLCYVFSAQKNDSHKDLLSTNIILVTDHRLIFVHKRIFPGHFVTTIKNSMVNDINIKSGILWGKIIIDSVKEEIILSNIDKKALDNISDELSIVLNRELKKRF